MEPSIPYGALQGPTDDEERELMDSDTWDWDSAVDADVVENPQISFPVALSLEEHRSIALAARAKQLTTPAYIKHVALRAAREHEAEEAMERRTATA